MQVRGQALRTIWLSEDAETVRVIDQRRLPHELVIAELRTLEDALHAISEMMVRGAPLIGATAAYGMALAMKGDPSDSALDRALARLIACRPTAVNLAWAASTVAQAVRPLEPRARFARALRTAQRISEDDVACCRSIGRHGADLLTELGAPDRPLQILTHCNAGWLATVDWGTALAPIYSAYDRGRKLHVWVDETRPRNQGAALTAWELGEHGIAHTVIADNAGGHLMRQGRIDVCIVGADRVAANGDVCNKIGTYLKALAAADNGVPFYAAFPHSTIDWGLDTGERIPIEERDADEVHTVVGRDAGGAVTRVRLTPAGSAAANFAFDVTPARLITGLITEKGICPASASGLAALYGPLPQARQR
jgi:methylthioribose-1-phosphate isomerase